MGYRKYIATTCQTATFSEVNTDAMWNFFNAVRDLIVKHEAKVDYFVGDNSATEVTYEDEGRTARIPTTSRFTLIAKIDGADHLPEVWAAEGHPEYPILTFSHRRA